MQSFIKYSCIIVGVFISLLGCQQSSNKGLIKNELIDVRLQYKSYTPKSTEKVISRAAYQEKLYGFWLGQCIANWTGLVTEMDKIGGEGKDGKAAGFYTRADWMAKAISKKQLKLVL